MTFEDLDYLGHIDRILLGSEAEPQGLIRLEAKKDGIHAFITYPKDSKFIHIAVESEEVEMAGLK